jgi:endonuclease-8
MPEGDSIFKLAAYLEPRLLGQTLERLELARRPVRDCVGRHIEQVFAHGKHLFIGLDNHQLLRSHLGMHGSWHSYAPGETWLRPAHRASIRIDIRERVFVCFNALQVEWLRDDGVRRRELARQLGPDLLGPSPPFADMVARARTIGHPDAVIADVLLNQRIATGIGNIYKSETLFIENVHPAHEFGDIDDQTLERLYRRAAALLSVNTGRGPRVTRCATDEAGIRWVYGRTGQPCLRCDTPIQSQRMGIKQRSTFWCPACQRLAESGQR